MNMFKKNGGFTLVELIVVIAILAILAGVAVPAYTGYITKAKQSADMQVLSSVNTAAQGLAVAEGVSVTSINVKNGTVTVVDSDTDTDGVEITSAEVTALTGDLADAFTEDFVEANWAKDSTGAGKWTAQYN